MRPDLARALAFAFLAGPWTRQGMVGSGSAVLRRRVDWLPALVRDVQVVYPTAPLDRPRELAAVLAARDVPRGAGRPLSRPAAPVRMVRNPWHLPELHDLAALARFLRLTSGELDWFADSSVRSSSRRGSG